MKTGEVRWGEEKSQPGSGELRAGQGRQVRSSLVKLGHVLSGKVM